MAIAFTAAPIIGQNFGARNSERVKATVGNVLMAATLVMVIATVVTQWQSELLLKGFTQDKATISEGALFLKMVSLNLVAQGLIFACSSAFQGLGNTRPQLISSTVRLVTYVIPTLWLSASRRTDRLPRPACRHCCLWLLGRELRKRLVFSQAGKHRHYAGF
jgi:Na+-driven multidrug efflux pump